MKESLGKAVQVADQPNAGLTDEEARQYHRSARLGSWIGRANHSLLYFVMTFGALLFMLPIYIMIAISLKSPVEISNTSMWSWPAHPTLENYRTVLADPDLAFIQKFWNTLLLAVVPTVANVTTSAMIAYPFARLRFRGRDRLFLILLSTMMLPGVVTLIPSYVMYAKLGWVDTYKPFIIPAFFGGGAFSIFFIRQFMLGIPREMDEAAKIDGATNAAIFWRVLLPNCGPVLATLAVFGFVGGFNSFMGPLMMLNDPDKMTLQVGLRSLQTAHQTDFHLLMAGAMIVLLPIFIIFVACQRYFVRGLALSGGK